MTQSYVRPVLASLALATGLAVTVPSSMAATINFDGFANGTNIHGLDLGGVTVTNPSGVVQIYSNNDFGVSNRSPNNAIGSFTFASSNNPMIFTFSAPVSAVGLFGGDEGFDIDSWSLTVFDAAIGGNALGTVASGDFNGDPYLGLNLVAAGIRRAEAVWTGTAFGMGFDDLSFTPERVTQVPLPAPALLLGAGLAGLVGMARRRKAG